MSKRITKQEFAAMLQTHPKTIERYLGPDNPDLMTIDQSIFRETTGYHKNPMNGRVSFDEHFARIYAANATGNDDLRGSEPAVIDAEIVTGRELVKTDQTAGIERREAIPGNLSAEIAAAFILPHKLYYSLDDAKALTGFPKSQLRTISELKFGRRVISRKKLEKI